MAELVPREWVARVFAPTVSMGWGLRATPTSGGACRSVGGMAVGFQRQILLVMSRHGIAAAFTGRKQWAFAPWMDLLELAAKTPSAVSTSVASPAGTAAAR